MPSRSSVVERGRVLRTLVATLALVSLASLPAACATEDKLTPPFTIQAPWMAERVWAVAPLGNESGVSAVDTLAISDRLVAEADGVQGVHCLPLNRTLAAMRGLGLESVETEADARVLMSVLQVDGLIVGSVTNYEPYRPLRLGVAVQLMSVDTPASPALSADELTLPTSDRAEQRAGDPYEINQFSRVYDARNHDDLARLRTYATGRYAPKSGYRDQVYLASMDAWSGFVAFDVVRNLIQTEAGRAMAAAEDGRRAGTKGGD